MERDNIHSRIKLHPSELKKFLDHLFCLFFLFAEVPVTVEKCVNSSEKTSQVLKYPSQIKIMVARSALNAGKEHLTVKGKVKKARDPKPSCNDSCRRCTRPKLTHSERLEINCAFWALKEHVKQWTFIQNSVSSVAPKMKTSASGVKGGKLSSRTYYFSVCEFVREFVRQCLETL